ncbi:MAG: flagellar assembly protein FliH, partial [Cycloclasticus sp.]|nr:flagellar assembly protein FliH [Cycloclasticus sp.]MBQ0789659.1 flagellar assembly protein FliH [Cycloclasticus sp.]
MSKPSTKDEVIASWQFPDFKRSGSTEVDISTVKAMTAGDLEKLQQQAITEASKKGYGEGFAQGLQDANAKTSETVERLKSMMDALQSPFEELDERVEHEMASLSIQIARQLVRREIKADSGQVVAVVKEALATLPSSSQNIQLLLHPDDASLVTSALSLGDADESRWQVVADPVITRGGC